ncbi:MAG: hypothetical protein EOO38_06710 [Cytophagaceae bacterium]|nr:MAG: hypothetical protein EOO38_06710 [Cytophagaceae bacterium]
MSLAAHHKRIAALLSEIYEYFDQPVGLHILMMRARDLERFTFGEVKWAIDTYRTQEPPEGHKKVPPEPHHLIKLLDPKMTPKEKAEQIASEVIRMVKKWGRPNIEKAKAEMMPEAWAVVLEEGGFDRLCQTMQEDDITQWNAQLRQKALTTLKRFELQTRQRQLAAVRQKEALSQGLKPGKKHLAKVSDILQQLPARMMQPHSPGGPA